MVLCFVGLFASSIFHFKNLSCSFLFSSGNMQFDSTGGLTPMQPDFDCLLCLEKMASLFFFKNGPEFNRSFWALCEKWTELSKSGMVAGLDPGLEGS